MNTEETITVGDADLLCAIADDPGEAFYLKGPNIARALRLERLGLVVPGRLNPRRYAVLTERGRAFVANRRGQ